MKTSVLTVSALNFYVKSLLDEDNHLNTVFLSGEISNLTDHYRSGHLYLSLKDEKSAIRAVMFSTYSQRLKFKPENGMKVLVRGRVSVYEATGQYQFYIEDMQPHGVGALNLAFEQLKTKLAKEGLFAEERKKELPLFPSRIAVITSPTGAAIQDICKIIGRRYPVAEIVLCPVLVQGEEAPTQIISALNRVNKLKCADIIIIGRGGGAIEDLWAFNNEQVVRAVYSSEIPVVSAVGHETDFTLCDFVADIRASTPSVAAELSTPLLSEMLCHLENIKSNLYNAISVRLCGEYQRLRALSVENLFQSHLGQVQKSQKYIDELTYKLDIEYQKAVLKEKNQLLPLISCLDSLSPLKVLSRGYSITEKLGNIVKTADDVESGDKITIHIADGKILCHVIEREYNDDEKNVGL